MAINYKNIYTKKTLFKLLLLFCYICFATFNFVGSQNDFAINNQFFYCYNNFLSQDTHSALVSRFSFAKHESCIDSRRILESWQTKYWISTNKGSSAFIYSGNENNPDRYAISYHNNQLGNVTALCPSILCDKSGSGGRLTALPFETLIKFDTCDWNIKYEGAVNGPTYISNEIADKMIELNNEYSEYKDLIGELFIANVNGSKRIYSINNIYSYDSDRTGLMDDCFGPSIVTWDDFIYDHDNYRIFLYSDSSIDNIEYHHFLLNSEKIRNLKIENKLFDNWQENKYTLFLENNINSQRSNTSLFFLILNYFFILINVIIIVCCLIKKIISLKSFIFVHILETVPWLVLINVINLFFSSYLNVSLFFNSLLSFNFILYFIFGFFAIALYKFLEKRLKNE